MLDQAYQKTEAGRAEIKARALSLSRSARNLLLVIDGSKSGAEWLALVNGVIEADLAYLIEQGLVAPAQGASAAAAASPLDPRQRLRAAFGDAPALNYEQLYSFLTGQGAKQLGALKRYAFTLEIEQCQGLEGLQQLALSLVERVAQSKGEAAAAELRVAMGMRG